MTISSGTRLGAYEVLGPLGAGGMGVTVGPISFPTADNSS
jgi:hypothetical protein